jgi:leucyl/phenylalanyl-tRNA--protein transferase
MQAAYTELYQQGWAHSFEVWQCDELVGGLYGVGIEGVFFGESMFSRSPNASKFALLAVQEAALFMGVRLIDCQVYNDHLASLGAHEVARLWFEQQLPTRLQPLVLPESSLLNRAVAAKCGQSLRAATGDRTWGVLDEA